MANATETILENGESLDVSEEQAQALAARGVIYRCTDRDCGNGCIFHIADGYTWANVEQTGGTAQAA